MNKVVGQGDSPLFAYGTLRLATVLRSLIGRELRASAGWLPGYAAFRLRGTPYPGVRRLRGAVTPGSLYSGLNGSDWQRLDHYEGVRYRRHLVRVIPQAGSAAVTAWVYLLAPTCRGQLSQEPWQISSFMQRRDRCQPLPINPAVNIAGLIVRHKDVPPLAIGQREPAKRQRIRTFAPAFRGRRPNRSGRSIWPPG